MSPSIPRGLGFRASRSRQRDSCLAFGNSGFGNLSCGVHKPQKVYTLSFIVGNIIPKSVKCIHSATKGMKFVTSGAELSHRLLIKG